MTPAAIAWWCVPRSDAEYHKGLTYLMGRVMAATQGRAHPQVARQVIIARLLHHLETT